MEEIDHSQVTDTEHQLLLQYHLILTQLRAINTKIARLDRAPTNQLVESLRFLENKVSLLSLLVKSAAFSFIVKHQKDIVYVDPQRSGNKRPREEHGEEEEEEERE